MKNLGKIILFIIFSTPLILNAGVVASVDTQNISAGERVTLSLTITGEDINRPQISQICSTDIVSSSSQTSIQMINNNYQKSYVLSYSFMPQESCTVEAIEFEIDGVLEKTEPIDISVKAYKRSKNDDFVLTFSTNKDEVYVGEPFELTLVFKQKRNIQAVDSKFVPSDLKGFWVKHESKPERHNENDIIVTKLVYTIAAQRAGVLEITPAQMNIATRANTRDTWGSFIPNVKWKKYLSNAVKLNVKELPKGVSLIGDFNIQARVDKQEVNQNEAVNVTVDVTGYGNLEDIKSFKPYIKGVSVFDEKISIDGLMLTQKIALVGDSDFVIPPFKLTYFDTQTKKVKMILTKEIKVKVNGSAPKELKIKRDESKKSIPAKVEVVEVSTNNITYLVGIALFLAGLFIGIVLMILKPWKNFKREKSFSIKEPKTLLVKLMPYQDDKKVSEIIDILEKNIYSNAKIEIDKKVLKEIVKKYSIR